MAGTPEFESDDLIEWAVSKEFDVPDWMTSNQSKEKTSKNKSPSANKPKRVRTDNLTKAINSVIQGMGRKPSFEELWDFFQSDKDDSGFIEDFKEEAITWRDTKGNFHDIPKTSLANRLSRIKHP